MFFLCKENWGIKDTFLGRYRYSGCSAVEKYVVCMLRFVKNWTNRYENWLEKQKLYPAAQKYNIFD